MDGECIDRFCDTLDATFLEDVSAKTRDLLIEYSIIAMKRGGRKKHIAKKVLQLWGLDDKGKAQPPPKQFARKHAEDTLKAFSIALTGARPDDILIGKSNTSRGAIIKIHYKPVYPNRKSIARLRGYPDLWRNYLVKLGGVPFFAQMTIPEREHWINVNQDPSDISIGEGKERIEFLQPGNSDFVKKLSEEQVELLMNGNPDSKDGFWTSREIEIMFPAKPGSKARRHTLILFRGMWKLTIDHEIVTETPEQTIDIKQGIIRQGYTAVSPRDMIYVLDDITRVYKKKGGKWIRPAGKKSVQKIAILVADDPVGPIGLTDASINSVIGEVYGKFATDEVRLIRYAMRKFTGAAYKSLLQKIIRFRAKYVEINGKLLATELVLLVTIGELVRYPGSFVPDIQRYVTGVESLAKRLAVTIFEDSSLPLPESQSLLGLLAAALLAQRVKTWSVSPDMVSLWMAVALAGLASPQAYVYDWRKSLNQQPYIIDSANNVMQICSALLDELKSFHSDMAMVRNIGANYSKLTFVPPSAQDTPQPKVMPFIHCVDQHWAPNIVYFFPPAVAKKVMLGSPANAPFSKLLGKIFREVTGVNPRRSFTKDFSQFEDKPFVQETRAAQQRVLIAKQTKQTLRPIIKEKTFTLVYTLDTSWLAGMVGALEIAGKPAVLVTLRADDPLQLVVIRRPSREMKDADLSPERYEEAIEMARELLRNGVPLNKTQPPSPFFKGAKVYLDDTDTETGNSYYIVSANGESIPWDEARQLELELPYYNQRDYSMLNALTRVGRGSERNARDSLEKLIQVTPPKVLRRALMYLSTFRPHIEINRVSRDGGGVKHAVIYQDIGAYQFMLQLSWIYPGALRPTEFQPGKFNVPVGPILWSITQKMRAVIAGDITKNIVAEWKTHSIKDRRKRKPWKHQTDSLEDMKRNHQAGNKGNFLSLSVGLGKTLIVMSYLKYLKRVQSLPQYIIYTLPQSAIKSVIQEIKAFGFDVNLLIPLKDISKKKIPKGVTVTQVCQPKPFTVTMLEHDYLRRCETELVTVAPDSIFIIDEVHKALNDTKRTSVALEISHLAREFVALTGTPVVDSKTYKLIWWLEQVVSFEVNEKNFWVAANSMIAKKANTGVIVESETVLALFNTREESGYSSSVPPALGGSNTSPTTTDWQMATNISYKACNREMIKQTLELLAAGRGVMLVARDSKHQAQLHRQLLKTSKLKASEIFVLTGGDSIFLTDEAVESGEEPDYRVVIVPIKKAEGYTLTRLSAMVTSVYPSNNATREQIEGRINRIGQKESHVLYKIVHAGILTRILEHHNDAKSLSLALQSLAEEVKAV